MTGGEETSTGFQVFTYYYYYLRGSLSLPPGLYAVALPSEATDTRITDMGASGPQTQPLSNSGTVLLAK